MPHRDDRRRGGGMKFQISNSLLLRYVGPAVALPSHRPVAIVAIILYIACWLILLSASRVDG